MDGDWVEGTPHWWWKYVFPRLSESIWEPIGPHPEPWRTSVVGALVSAVSIKEVARRMQNEAQGSELVERYDRAISEITETAIYSNLSNCF